MEADASPVTNLHLHVVGDPFHRVTGNGRQCDYPGKPTHIPCRGCLEKRTRAAPTAMLCGSPLHGRMSAFIKERAKFDRFDGAESKALGVTTRKPGTC